MFLLSVWDGIISARAILEAKVSDVVLTLKDHSDIKNMVLVRLIDGGAIVRAADTKSISYYPWDKIDHLAMSD